METGLVCTQMSLSFDGGSALVHLPIRCAMHGVPEETIDLRIWVEDAASMTQTELFQAALRRAAKIIKMTLRSE